MGVRTHEVHASLVHAPLTLIPLAAMVDLTAALSPSRFRSLDGLGSKLWLAAGLGGVAAGLTGLAASQQIHYPSRTARDMTFVHAVGNEGLLVGVLGLAAWRRSRPVTLSSALLGLLVSAAGFYTAYLGGEMVYQHQVGVAGMDSEEAKRRSPPLLSAAAPVRLLADAVRGVRWLFDRGMATRREGLSREAMGLSSAGLRLTASPFDLQREAAEAWRG
jgi:uncharacterized membrane protein